MELPAVDVRGRVAVVTGSARGIGHALLEGFLEAGANAVAIDRSWDGVGDFTDRLHANYAKQVLQIQADISSDADLDEAYQKTLDRFGTVDVLVNDAAVLGGYLFPPSGKIRILDTKDSDWEQMYRVNVFGALKVIRRFIRPMLEKQRGSIINISSSGSWVALRPDSMEQPYMSSKAAVTNMSFYLAEEVKDANIAVNVVFPGHTRTTNMDEQDVARRVAGLHVRERVEPQHAAPLVLFLAQQEAKGGFTGRALSATDWNQEHGLGGPEQWTRSALEGRR